MQRTHVSLPTDALRRIGPPGFLIGASVHSLAQAHEAVSQGADFLVFGPIYDTPSKRQYGAPQGLAALERVAAASTRPVIAVGGITPERVAEVRAAGAAGIAVISAIIAAACPADRTRGIPGRARPRVTAPPGAGRALVRDPRSLALPPPARVFATL